ncbi:MULTISPECIES: hypothetical protein [unclassified Bradyrhizobium]|jgi:hypothetical protein|uniref:hypothetical protein n=1 Tax=unclassified Bradyrhizobium TaxID=2631580 RepID=UPI001910CB2D|nr:MULTISPECIES: hypothetical protein [unclassified Bradyrhizobium]
MGSSGSGRISDYPGSSGKGSVESTGGGSGSGGGSDRCAQAFAVSLEDIEHCDFHKTTGAVPAPGQQLRIALKKRVVAETDAGVTVGNLPTTLNYLAGCLKDGWTYTGTITSSNASGAVAKVLADFAPSSHP